MKPGAGAAEKLSQSADADHMDQRAWQRENQIRGGIKSTGGRRSACAFCRISVQNIAGVWKERRDIFGIAGQNVCGNCRSLRTE